MRTILRLPEFIDWLAGLRDRVAKAAIANRLDRAALGNLGTVRPVGEGVSEMKVDVGPGYRVYYVTRGEVVIVLLCGGDKSTQKKDIKRAHKLAKELED
ncbi:type II toxin-antitoxin system RelE/ParE family toxin [Burkholderia ubonensis]|uniref:Addiction module antitoxin RelB n=1 Tax=Burkholderia ubonensis TaxID=101571 RepID=A0ABD4E3N1_9BURK|nr:type II toxin-antitoxin system RelE/ParE family toxin [Burkholderia ubonensis]KVN83509.1 addiction module antitoxin RelB [Burkholderia ubonensis]